MITLQNSTIRCKKLATIVPCRKKVTRPFVSVTKIGKEECCTLLLYFGTRAYLFSPEERSCYVFSTRNNCCKFFASDGAIFQSVNKPFFKTPVFGAPLTSLHYSIFFKCKDSKRFNKMFHL